MQEQRATQTEPARKPWRQILKDVAFGMIAYDFARHAAEERAGLQTVFMVLILGHGIGLPILPPYYSFRLLPYVVPEVESWKRRVLRERDLTEEHEHHLHGI